MNIPLWYMDTEFCPCCDALLGYFGECTNPLCLSWDSWVADDDDEHEGSEHDPYLRFNGDGWDEEEESELIFPSS